MTTKNRNRSIIAAWCISWIAICWTYPYFLPDYIQTGAIGIAVPQFFVGYKVTGWFFNKFDPM